MKLFYNCLSLQWFELPAVNLAFGVDYRKPVGARAPMVRANIRSLHQVRALEDIKPIVFLNTLKAKGILHTLPATLDRFKDERLLKKGPYGDHYQVLYRLGWFHNPKVSSAFGVTYDQEPATRTQKIKDAIYWSLGAVSMTQIHPSDFCDLIICKGIRFTLPARLAQAAEAHYA